MLKETKRAMVENGGHWYVPFMDYVDAFRSSKSPQEMIDRWTLDHPRYDALLASTVEYLCDERAIEPPDWIWEVPSIPDPWFVSGIENLKALAIAGSPPHFRRRKIFVLDNFLSRV
jgi:hypothetical protein